MQRAGAAWTTGATSDAFTELAAATAAGNSTAPMGTFEQAAESMQATIEIRGTTL
ncbi:MAG: hypothetical protein ACLP8S_27545 [Solirubrobacteraceae bacterium]